MKGDSKEQIERCLACRKYKCNNCVDNRYKGISMTDKYIWEGTERTVGELAKMTDMRLDRFKYRIQVGGIDFAMSAYKTHAQWRKAKEGN